MKLGQRETLFDQFTRVRTLTINSHVNLYGEVEMGQSRLKEFIAYKPEKKSMSSEESATSAFLTAIVVARLLLLCPGYYAQDQNDILMYDRAGERSCWRQAEGCR